MASGSSKSPTHMLSLSVQTTDVDEWNNMWKGFAKLAGEIGEKNKNVHVSSTLLDEIEDELVREETTYNDQTLKKVYNAILEAGCDRFQATQIINEVLNAGILFRERV